MADLGELARPERRKPDRRAEDAAVPLWVEQAEGPEEKPRWAAHVPNHSPAGLLVVLKRTQDSVVIG